MTYKVVQEVKGKYYLYEVTAVWDPEKKNSKQKRKYLGKCDKDGNLLSVKKSKSIISKSFGQYYLLREMWGRCDLLDDLRDVYGDDGARKLLALSATRAVRAGDPVRSFDLINESFLQEFLEITNLADWTPHSKMLENLAAMYERRFEFFSKLMDDRSAVVYELTSLRQPFIALEQSGYFAKYSFIGMPKSTVFLSVSASSRLPVHFSIVPGDATVSSINHVAAELNGLGIDRPEFFLSPRTLFEKQVGELAGTSAVVSFHLNTDSGIGKRLLSESVKLFKTESSTYVLDGTVYRVYERPLNGARAVVYLNEQRRNDELFSIYSAMDGVEAAAEGLEWTDDAVDVLIRRSGFVGVPDLFNVSRGENGNVVVKRKRNAVSAVENRCGRSVVFTTTSRSWDDLIMQSGRLSVLEHQLKIFKTDLEGGSRYFPSMATAEGTFLDEFIGIRMQSQLMESLRGSSISRSITHQEAISEMGKLKVTLIDGEWRLSELTHVQVSILSGLGIPVPTDEMVNELVRRRGARFRTSDLPIR